MSNVGVAPLDPDSLIGRVRSLIGDVTSVALNPVVEGYGDYGYFSDGEVAIFLLESGSNVKRAAGLAYLQFAAAANADSVNAQSADMKADLTKRASDYRQIAESYFTQADAEERRAKIADGDMFIVTPGSVEEFAAVAPDLTEDPSNPGYYLP